MPHTTLARITAVSVVSFAAIVLNGAQIPYVVPIPSQGGGVVVSDPTIRPMQEPGSPASIFAARPVDLRGIGRPDMILCYGIVPPAPSKKMPIRILRPQTEGSLADITRQLLGDGLLPGAVAPRVIVEGDFNEDGRVDIFVACQGWDANPFPGEVNVLLLSNPDGTYTDASANLPQIPDFTHDAAVGDVNGDDHLDIYVGNVSGQQSVGPYFLHGNGDGTFTKVTSGLPASITSTTEKFTACGIVDIDGDGASDLVLGTHGDGGFLDSIILFNDGTGNFTVRPRLVLPDGPLGRGNTVVQGVGVLDINRDGRPDLILPSSQYSTFSGLGLQILINQGNGTLTDESVARLGSSAARFTGSPYQAPRYADLNYDGLTDFYFSNGPVEDVPRYFLAESDGTFTAVPPSGPDALPLGFGFGVTALHFDGDARIDLVQASHTTEGDVLYKSFLNRTVAPPVQTHVAAIGASPLKAPLTADFSPGSTFTMEGWFYLTGYSQRSWIMGKEQATGGDPYLSFGLILDGTSGSRLEFGYSTGVPGSYSGISSAAPLPLNTWLHFAAVMDGTNTRLLINGQVVATGAAPGPPPKLDNVAFGVGQAFFADGSLSYNPFPGYARQVRYWNAARSDAQIMTALAESLPMDRTGLVAAWPLDETGGSTARDISGAGRDLSVHLGTDLVALRTKVLAAQPFFSRAATAVTDGSLTYIRDGVLIDFDSDGDQDLVIIQIGPPSYPVANATPLRAFRNDTGVFVDATAAVLGNITMVWPRHYFVGDFNGDGRADLLIADTGTDIPPFPGDQSKLLIQSSDGRLLDETAIRLPQHSSYTHSITAGDIEGDGDLDIYMCNLNGGDPTIGPRFYINNGSGNFTEATDRIPADISNREFNSTFTWSLLQDVSGDGRPDLVLGGWDGAPINAILLNDGTGHFVRDSNYVLPPKLFGANGQTTDISSGDFNGDGRPDLVLATTDKYTAAGMQLLINHGNGVFTDETATAGFDWSNRESSVIWSRVLDLNGDGKPDILATVSTTDQNGGYAGAKPRIFINDRDAQAVRFVDASSVYSPPAGIATAILAGDFDLDGKYDLLTASNEAMTVDRSLRLIEPSLFHDPPTITTQPADQAVLIGGSATFTASASGTPAPTFQWQKNGKSVPGANAGSLTIPSVSAGDLGIYRLIATNDYGTAMSHVATLAIATPPAITTHPASQTVVGGNQVVLSVIASGAPPLTYQWRKGGVVIDGATGSSLAFASAQPSDSGIYSVVVTNPAGSTTSADASLTVQNPTLPSFNQHPQSQTIVAGNPATFSATATGLPEPTYKWKKGGVDIPGATGSSYSFVTVFPENAGEYSVTATNSEGSVTSNIATLTVHYLAGFTLVPGNVTQNVGTTFNWEVAANGNPAPTFRWRKNGADIPGATGNSFSVPSVSLADAGTYSVMASNVAGSIESAAWTLTVTAPPAFTTHPVTQTKFEGESVTFTVAVTGAPAPALQWRKDGADIPGATTASYTINSLLLSNAGNYGCVATNTVGSVTSNTASLTVAAVPVAPVITTHPASRNILQGQPGSFTVVAVGQAPLSYQWRRNGNSIAGATAATYSIANAASTHAGTYTVVVSNTAGSATSNPATLTVTAVAGGTGAKLHGIGDLPGGTGLSEVRDATLANGVLHAVGTSNGEGGLDRGIYWTSINGLSALPDLAGNIGHATPIIASAITPDAAFIASRARKPAVAQRTAVRVATAQLPDAAANLDIGAGFGNSAANTISADGTVLHGFSGNSAFRHEIGGAGTTVIPPLPGTFNSSVPAGRGASSDGSIVIGSMSQNGSAISSAAWRYVHGTGVAPLPKLPEGTWNQAVALSPDGRLALLNGNSTAFADGEFYLHNADTGHLTPLGAPTAAGFPANLGGMTADGSVIGVNRYIRNASGWHLFETVLIAAGINMTGWAEMGVLGLSHDGRLVWGRGSHNGNPEGYIAELPAGFLFTYGAAIAFHGVGDLPGGAVSSEIRDATKIGGLIRAVGNSIDENNQTRAVMWTQGAGLTALPEIVSNPAAQSFVTASAITPDGAFIASRARNTASGPGRTAVRVAASDLATLDLNSGAIVGASAALAISDNGAVLYGLANNNSQAARFTSAGATATLIPPLPGHDANDIALDGASADGSVVAGTSYPAGTPTFGAGQVAFRYVHGSGAAPIAFLPGGTRNRSIALSADGNTTMLVGDSTAQPTGEVYLHSASNGTLSALGRPSLGVNNSGGITADLSVVVIGKEVRNAHGWHSLRGILANSGVNMAGWTIESILGISRNGRLVYGRGTRGGNPEGFVAEFPQGYLAGWSRPAIVGAWTVGDPTQDGATVVVFTDEGRYFHIQNATPEEESLGGGTGFERGTYTWNRQTGALAVTTEFDNNGDIGLSGLNGASGFKFTVSGDTATATVPGEGDIPLARVLGSSPIVGAWGVMDSATEGFVIVLLPDGIYFHLEEGAAGEGGMSGIEHGTYTWDSTTSLITSARSPAPFTDTNGEWGLSHPDGDLIVNVSADRSRLIVGDEFIPRIGPSDAGPVVTTQPQSAAVNSGGSITLRVAASVSGGSASYQWLLNGAPIPGATGATYSIASFSMSNVGTYSVVVTNGTSSTVSRAATLTLGVPRLVNLSTRAFAGAGDATLVLGFYIQGTGTKTLLIRGIGPKLLDYIPPPVVADPALAVYKDQAQIAFNQDWDASLAPDFASVGAFALDPGSKDAAMRLTLEPGGYTVHLVNNGPVAEAVIEIYDISKDPGTKLVNLSCRFSFAAGQTVIVGTYLEGAPRTIIARSAGPELGLPPYNVAGVLADPKLEMFAGATSIGVNDDWDAALASFFGPVGAFPFTAGSKDAATRVTLQPGGYTVHATGKGGAGVAIVELYAEP